MKYSQSVCALNCFESLKTIDQLVENGLEYIHIDFMDSFYTKNFGFSFEAASYLIKRYQNVNFDAHLMVKNPTKIIKKLIELGFKTIFLPANEINHIEFMNIAKNYPDIYFGVMLETENNPEDFKQIIQCSAKILLMTIDKIGGTGQMLNNNLFKKVKTIKKINPNIKIYSDGGLRDYNSMEFYKNNIDVAVGGSIIFSFETIKEFLCWWKEKYDS
ncbi:ribulose phosphate epimerase [Mycoplasmopsis cynos]|uniref:ribulose phosphate epimerase n=1 Tax=Mycoplasmopsis cynos TaxID=171284 RepID=UPI002AFECC4C|nr:ribulose phosphate epimerase [Mycoplasmopsis cynos]WQQ16436.1 ribulose phosphate epimerase [Mycoplasmopsis cynos]